MQLSNLITMTRGEPCVPTVHLSDILELHPSPMSLLLDFKPNNDRKRGAENSSGLSSICRCFSLELQQLLFFCGLSFQTPLVPLLKERIGTAALDVVNPCLVL